MRSPAHPLCSPPPCHALPPHPLCPPVPPMRGGRQGRRGEHRSPLLPLWRRGRGGGEVSAAAVSPHPPYPPSPLTGEGGQGGALEWGEASPRPCCLLFSLLPSPPQGEKGEHCSPRCPCPLSHVFCWGSVCDCAIASLAAGTREWFRPAAQDSAARRQRRSSRRRWRLRCSVLPGGCRPSCRIRIPILSDRYVNRRPG